MDLRISRTEKPCATRETAANLPLMLSISGWPASFPNAGLGTRRPQGLRIPIRSSLRTVAPRTLACTGSGHRAYFMPESAMPSVMYRCRNRKMIMIGIDAIAAPAMISPWNDPFS